MKTRHACRHNKIITLSMAEEENLAPFSQQLGGVSWERLAAFSVRSSLVRLQQQGRAPREQRIQQSHA